MEGVALVTALALLEVSVLASLTGAARVKYKVEAPATTGNPIFERYFRVHQNTLENLIVFIPALWLFAEYGNIMGAVILGLLFILARAVYAVGYISDPARRSAGAISTFAINGILLIGAIIGLARSLV